MYAHSNASMHKSPGAKYKYAREACTHAYTYILTEPNTLHCMHAMPIAYTHYPHQDPHMNLNPTLTLCRSESQLYLTSFAKVPSLQNDKMLKGKTNTHTLYPLLMLGNNKLGQS